MKALIPIKNHSARVPGKNFAILNGKPLFMWIIESLLEVSEISEILIDTDSKSEELWQLNRNPKIKIQVRAPHLCGDEVDVNFLLKDLIQNNDGDDFIMTHVTNPFISALTINCVIESYHKSKLLGYDSLFTVDQIQGRLFDANLKPINHDIETLIKTQDLPPIYLENSCLYLFSRHSFNKTNRRIGLNPSIYVTPLLESIDIDTKEEWRLAQLVSENY
jgi:CMP-N-acetylneuraminic acid synthetase